MICGEIMQNTAIREFERVQFHLYIVHDDHLIRRSFTRDLAKRTVRLCVRLLFLNTRWMMALNLRMNEAKPGTSQAERGNYGKALAYSASRSLAGFK